MLFDTPIGDITEADLQDLVDGAVEESRRLDFKAELPGNSDKDRRNFLADVTAFANTDGGDILCGVAESNSVAAAVPGVEGTEADSAICRLEQLMQTGIDERLSGVELRAVPLSSGRVVLVVRVPRSFARPHMVTACDSRRFYGRGEKANYRLDVREIRALALRSTTLAERARAFLAERYMLIKAGQDPVPLLDGPKLVVHLIPCSALELGAAVDLARVSESRDAEHWKHLWPLGHRGGNPFWAAEGYAIYRPFSAESQLGYGLLFREGVMEGVSSEALNADWIAGVKYEEDVLRWTMDGLQLLQHLGVPAPVLLAVALLGVGGSRMGVGGGHGRDRRQPIAKPDLVPPAQLLQSHQDGAERVLRPAFDAIWNAAGWPGSLNYDEAGNWRPHSR